MDLRKGWGVAALASVALLSAGCGPGADPAARAVAVAFADAVESGDGAAACQLLAPGTKAELEQSAGTACAAAILEEDLAAPGAAEKATSFGTMAKVEFAQDTMFVTEFKRGWRVMAAGCSPVPGHPYDCRLEGG